MVTIYALNKQKKKKKKKKIQNFQHNNAKKKKKKKIISLNHHFGNSVIHYIYINLSFVNANRLGGDHLLYLCLHTIYCTAGKIVLSCQDRILLVVNRKPCRTRPRENQKNSRSGPKLRILDRFQTPRNANKLVQQVCAMNPIFPQPTNFHESMMSKKITNGQVFPN